MSQSYTPGLKILLKTIFKAISRRSRFIYLAVYSLNNKKMVKSIIIGAQNCTHHENYGPFTGSVSASMLKNVGAKYIILGHSENRSDGDTVARGTNSGKKERVCYKTLRA